MTIVLILAALATNVVAWIVTYRAVNLADEASERSIGYMNEAKASEHNAADAQRLYSEERRQHRLLLKRRSSKAVQPAEVVAVFGRVVETSERPPLVIDDDSPPPETVNG